MINSKITFWGSSEFSVYCLEELKNLDILPSLIITTPDAKVGRGLILTANIVKIWAKQNDIPCLTPNKLNKDFIVELKNIGGDIALVASYGKIIPQEIINLPKYKTLNIHPSLLPKYRGPSPLQEQIINNDKATGVTIMQIDEQVDHGPIIIQEKLSESHNLVNKPVSFNELEKITAKMGVVLFAKILPLWIAGEIKATEQNHSEATFTKKVEKNDGLIDLELDKPARNYLKYLAYSTWPGTFFFLNKDGKKIRVIIKDTEYKDEQFIINRVLPEGKKEMSYDDFLRGIK